MKTFKFAALALLAVSTVFTSCEDDGSVIPGPTVNIISPTSSPVVPAGGSFDVEVTASTNEKLESFVVETSFSGLTETPIDSTLDNGTTSFTFAGSLDVAQSEGTQLFNFSFTDSKGGTTTKSLEVTIADLASGTNDGTVWNVEGPNKGAWDLVNDVAVSKSGAESTKDLLDNTNETALLFLSQWTSGNGTLFVRDNDIDFDNVSLGEAIDAYAAGTESETTPILADNDVIIAYNTRFDKNYVVIKVNTVTSTLDDNEDNITFTYKK